MDYNQTMNSLNKKNEILKLQGIIKKGHLPSRGRTRYGEAVLYANCLEHACFNFSNDQLIDNFSLAKSRFTFAAFDQLEAKPLINEICEFVKSTGLILTPCNPKDIIGPKQWKIALYIFENKTHKETDFHFLLQEKDGLWSEKFGFNKEISLYGDLRQKVFATNNPFDDENAYELVETYTITNPYAKENE